MSNFVIQIQLLLSVKYCYSPCRGKCGDFCLFQAEDGIRDLVRSRGLGDVYKRQIDAAWDKKIGFEKIKELAEYAAKKKVGILLWYNSCLLYTSDAADERSSVDLGGRRIIKKKKSMSDKHHTNCIK